MWSSFQRKNETKLAAARNPTAVTIQASRSRRATASEAAGCTGAQVCGFRLDVDGRKLVRSGVRGRRHLAVCALLVAAIAVVYSEVGSHAYLNLDDDVYVLRNPWIRDGLRWDTVRWAFTRVYEAYWIPLTWLSLALDCRLFG